MANVTIQGSLCLALGLGPVVGSIRVSNPSFTDANGVFHPEDTAVIPIGNDGSYSFTLAPTEQGTPGPVFYTAAYYIGPGGMLEATESWSVPVTTAMLSIDQIRVNKSIPPAPFLVQVSQLYSATANIGDVLVFNGHNYVPVTLQTSFPFAFTTVSNISISQTQHAQGTSLFVRVYDSSGNQLDAAVKVEPVSGNVTITFGSDRSGFGFVYGGLGRGLPNASKLFVNQASGVFHQSEHRFNTPNLDVAIYDSSGNEIDANASIQLSPSFDISITFSGPKTFKAVVLGALGATVPQNALTVVPVPTSSAGPGQPGQQADDGTYHYFCVAPNVWKRVSLASF